MLYVCGLRVSEVCSLTWNDLQPHASGGKATVFGKGAKTRVVLVPQLLWGQLMSLKMNSELGIPNSELGKKKNSELSRAVFVSRTGRPLERTMVFKIVKQCAQRAGNS